MSAPLVLGRANWLSIIFQVGLVVLITYLYNGAGVEQPFIFAALTYSVAAFILRSVFGLYFKAGRHLMRKGKYTEAILYFEKALNYYTTKKWVDRYRFITMLSATKTSYYGMSLCNIAFSYAQTGDREKAKEYYRRALAEDPQNNLAYSALNMLNSAEKQG